MQAHLVATRLGTVAAYPAPGPVANTRRVADRNPLRRRHDEVSAPDCNQRRFHDLLAPPPDSRKRPPFPHRRRFPKEGLYHIYADDTPRGIGQQVLRYELRVGSQIERGRSLVPTGTEVTAGPYRVRLNRPFALMLTALALSGAARAATPTIVVSNVWSRPANGTAVVYAMLRNRATLSDRLIGAISPAASSVTLHETSDVKMPSKSTSMDDMPMSGAMTSMKALSSITIPAHGTTSLAPGGYHLMLDLRHGTRSGQMIPLRLHFARAGWIATSATVRAIR